MKEYKNDKRACLRLNHVMHAITSIFIHMEAERRRREAGVQQAIENGLRSYL